jgi:hypothetical protein
MRSGILKNQIGSTTVEKTVVIIILVVFLIICFLIIASIYHFSLFGSGQTIPRFNTAPVVCSLSFINFSTAGSGSCLYYISASAGSPGLTYKLYNNVTGLMGSYVVGESSYGENISISKPTRGDTYYTFTCNTSGSSVAQNGFYYSAGGAAELVIPC